MEKLVCTQCGAPINPETLVCDYCGSIFLSSKIETKKNAKKKINVPLVIDDELKNSIESYLNVNNKSSGVVVTFYIVFVIVAIFIITTAFRTSLLGNIISIFLFAFIVFAVASTSKNVLSNPKLKYKTALDALNKGNYVTAYEEFKKLEQTKHDVKNLYAMLLIGFYRLDKFDESRDLIIGMEAKELSSILHADINVLAIAGLLNIRTPQCHDPNCEKHNHTTEHNH